MLVAFPRLVGGKCNPLSTLPPFFCLKKQLRRATESCQLAAGFNLELKLKFCSQMSCSVSVHCIKQMVWITQGGEFAYRIPILYLPRLLQRNYVPCVLHLNVRGGWGHWNRVPRWLLLLLPLPLWEAPKGCKDTPQLQVLQLQVLNGILQRPINTNLLENTTQASLHLVIKSEHS